MTKSNTLLSFCFVFSFLVSSLFFYAYGEENVPFKGGYRVAYAKNFEALVAKVIAIVQNNSLFKEKHKDTIT